MKTFNSEKRLGDKVRKVKVTFDLNTAIDKLGYERVETLVGGWVVAHSVAERLKRAYDVVGSEKASEQAKTNAAWLRKRVEDGETFDGIDFIPKERGADKVVLMIREKWEGSTAKQKFLDAHKLGDLCTVDSSAQEVEEAYLASKDEQVEL